MLATLGTSIEWTFDAIDEERAGYDAILYDHGKEITFKLEENYKKRDSDGFASKLFTLINKFEDDIAYCKRLESSHPMDQYTIVIGLYRRIIADIKKEFNIN